MYTNVNTPHELTSWNRVCDNIDLIKVPSANAEEIEYEIKVYVDKNGKLYYYNDQGKKQYIESTVQNPPTTDKDIESEQNVGNIKPGDTIPGGSTITDVVDQIVGTADWTGTYPKAYVFVTQVGDTYINDNEDNVDFYLYVDQSTNSSTLNYGISVKNGYFEFNGEKRWIPKSMNHSPSYTMQIDMSYPHTANLSGQYSFPETEAKDYGLKNSKDEDSACVLAAKALDYTKNIHICDPLFHLIKPTGSTATDYEKSIINNDKETSYDFTVNPGQTLSLSILNGYSYSIKDEYGTSITPSVNGNYYEISIASTGVTSTFTITLNPNSEGNDN